MTPKQNSTGGKEKFGSITTQGNRYIRPLLVLGAISVLRAAPKRKGALCDWLAALRARKPPKVVAVALANKLARIVWAIITTADGQTTRRVLYKRPTDRLGDILNTAPEPTYNPGRAALPAIRGALGVSERVILHLDDRSVYRALDIDSGRIPASVPGRAIALPDDVRDLAGLPPKGTAPPVAGAELVLLRLGKGDEPDVQAIRHAETQPPGLLHQQEERFGQQLRRIRDRCQVNGEQDGCAPPHRAPRERLAETECCGHGQD